MPWIWAGLVINSNKALFLFSVGFLGFFFWGVGVVLVMASWGLVVCACGKGT